MKPVRLGLWGCGAMGAYHAQRFSRNPAVALAACWDRDAGRAEELAQQVGFGAVATSFADFAARCDAVSVAVVDREHVAAAHQVADAGLALFLEKPMGRSAAETGPLAARIQALNLPLVVNYSKRNAPALAHARRLLAEGRIGTVTSARLSYLQSWIVDNSWGAWKTDPRWQWRTTEAASCYGVIGDLASHLFDAATWLLPGNLHFHSGQGRRTPVEARWGGAWESAKWTAAAGDVPVEFEVSRVAAGHLDDVTLTFEGSEGRLDLDLGARKNEVQWTPRGQTARLLPAEPVVSTYDAFVRLVQGNALEENVPSGAQGHLVQVLVDEANRVLVEARP